MKKTVCLFLALVLLTLGLASCGEKEREAPKTEDIDMSVIEDMSGVSVSEKKTDYVIIDVKNFGKIVVRLYPDVAPETVKNFKKLVGEGFYDGLTFHRVMSGFMIQGGDPKGDGTGGSEPNIKGEFDRNDFENNLLHVRGVLSMARQSSTYEQYEQYFPEDSLTPEQLQAKKDAYNTASSQFFIVHQTSLNNSISLDGNYAAFGYVIYGMDVVDKIATVSTNDSDKPVNSVVINSIKFAKVTK